MKRIAMLAVVSGCLLATSAFGADKKIERVWKSKCSACHGMDGKGQTEKGKKMQVLDLAASKATDEDFKKQILEGVKKEEKGVKKEMDGFKAELKPEEVDGLIAYIHEIAKK